MKNFLVALLYLCLALLHNAYGQNPIESYKSDAHQLIQTSLADSSVYDKLTYLTDTFGPRFSGTESLEKAIDWVLGELNKEDFDSVYTQPVRVPRWVRGKESVTMLEPRVDQFNMLGLGGSVGTEKDGITAEVLVVRSIEELNKRKQEAQGKIIVFNVPFVAYGKTVAIRYRGAIEAAKVGGVVSLIRSISPYSMNTPHTGTMSYDPEVKKIPHAALTIEDVMMLQRFQDRGQKVVLNVKMEAKFTDSTLSRNVIAEIEGSETPEEVVVLGGHIDSWDVGTGAMDDAGGCLVSWQALSMIKRLGLKPKRTIRLVMWTNEENGLRGGHVYRDSVRTEMENHVLAIESDSGVFEPQGFGFSGSEEAYEMINAIGKLLEPIGAQNVFKGGGGADIGPLMREGVPGMGLLVDGSRYFWYHHTQADTADKLDVTEMQKSAAAMAVMAYIVADMEERLPWQNK